MLNAFFDAIHDDPNDETSWLAMADWLDEQGQESRAELVRLCRRLRVMPIKKRQPDRVAMEERVIALLDAGTPPVVPELINSIGMRLALIPPGYFTMGSAASEAKRDDDEGPQHLVELTKAVYMGVFLVTQQQYQRLVGRNPSRFSPTGSSANVTLGVDTSTYPVEQVTWHEAAEYCRLLSELPGERAAKRSYRLVSEAEWEYGCRGGVIAKHVFHYGNTLSSHQANCNGGEPYGEAPQGPNRLQPTPVGTFPPNAFGLYDMHGNLLEWCADWYQPSYYNVSPRWDPMGPDAGDGKVYRGGSWSHAPRFCRSANRNGYRPDGRSSDLGFRVVAVIG